MKAQVPNTIVDNDYEAFPEGFYDGEISGAQLRDPNNDGSWLILKLSLTNVTPKDGTQDPGRNRFSGDITLRTDGTDLFEVSNFADNELHFAIRRSAGLLAGLGEGLGVATRVGGSVDVDLKAVAEALIDGNFENAKVGFQVSHYTNKKSGKTYDQFARFGSAS